MNHQTYLFYDLETTGLNKAFDQILQFAAIRTDRQLNMLQEHEIHVRLRPDVLYSPEAMLTTGISVQEALDAQTSEYEAAQRMHVLFNQPGTVSVGYNTMGFDDEFMRFTFYRNLLPPYQHQWKNDCSRMDILPLAALYYLYNPSIIDEWPELDGKPSMKLEHLNEANQWVDGAAHDAMVDVKVTLELARRMAEDEKMWQYAHSFFEKRKDEQRIRQLPVSAQLGNHEYRTGLLVSVSAGTANRYQMPALHLGRSDTYKNQSLWLRLDQEPETFHQLAELDTLEEADLKEATWVIRKKFGEPPLILPPNDRYWEALTEQSQERAQQNQQWLIAHPEILRRVTDYYRAFTWPDIPDIDPYAALYQGFLSNDDLQRATQFHLASPQQKADFIDQFEDPRFQKLAKRLVALQQDSQTPNFSFGLDAFGSPRPTPKELMDRIQSLQEENGTDVNSQLLRELSAYLKQL
jgi:exodeoxyribonuclease-1